jgi:hypothetical protein
LAARIAARQSAQETDSGTSGGTGDAAGRRGCDLRSLGEKPPVGAGTASGSRRGIEIENDRTARKRLFYSTEIGVRKILTGQWMQEI